MVEDDQPTRECPAVKPEDLGFGVLFEAIRDAVVVGDARTGCIVLWNPAAERLFGYAAEDVIGRSLEILVPAQLRERHRAGIAAFAAAGRGPLIDADEPIELPALRGDGSEIAVELSLSPLHSDGPCPRHVLALVRDATARRRLAAEREAVLATARDYARRLEELAAMRSTFTAMVAHELGSPLAAIRGLADLLIAGAVPAAQHPPLAVAIRAEADLLRRLVADVEAAAMVEQDDFAVHRRAVPVAGLLADAVAFARTQWGDAVVSTDYEPEAVASRVLADPDRIGQVMRNLIGNATKHTPPGTPIDIRARCAGERVRIEVVDAGPGIAPHDLRRIFEKYGRGCDAEGNRVPGVGLGLYLARRIVAEHGSELGVESTPGQGSVFGFSLEVAP